MSVSRIRTANALAATATAMLLITACGGGSGSVDKDNSSKKPAATTAVVVPKPSATTPAFVKGLIVERCFNDANNSGALMLELGNYLGKTKAAARTITWMSTDLNTHSVGGCGGKYAAAGYTKDYKRLYVSRLDPSNRTYAIGYLSMDNGSFTQLTTPATSDFGKVSETDPSVFGDRVYFYDVAGEHPALKSMTLDGKEARSEAALQKQFRDNGPSQSVGSEVTPYIVPGLSKPVIDADASDETAYTADGSIRAKLEASGPISVTRGGQTVEYNVDMPEDAPTSFQGSYRLGGFVGNDTLIMSDGKQIYSGKLAGDTVKFKTILSNTTEKVVTDVLVGADGTVTFVYELKPGLGITSETTAIYIMAATGGTASKIDEFSNPGLQASVNLVASN